MANLIQRVFSKQIDKAAEEKAATIATTLQAGLDDRFNRIQEAVSMFNNLITYNNAYKSGKDVERYANSADVYAVVRMIAKTAAKVPLFAYVVKDEKAYKEFKEWVPDEKGYSNAYLLRYKELHTKALEPLGDQDPLQVLLDNPNDIDEKQEFYTGVYGNKLLTGNSFVNLPIIPDGPNKDKVLGMYMLPPGYMTVVAAGVIRPTILGYTLNLNSLMDFKPEEILHLKYWNPLWGMTGTQLIGMSPLQPLCKELEIAEAAGSNEYSQFKHGGPPVVVNNKSLSADQTGVDLGFQIAKRWAKEKEGPENAGKWMFSPGEIDVHVVGHSPVDLNILERGKVSLGRVCNCFSVSDTLFNNNQASTESNVQEMQKSLYTNGALPEVYSLRDGLNRKLSKRYSKGRTKVVIDCDITGIPQLQPNYLQMAQVFNTLPIMIPNNIMDAFKYGRLEDPNMDKVYVKSGYQLLEDLNMQVEDIQTDPNNPEDL